MALKELDDLLPPPAPKPRGITETPRARTVKGGAGQKFSQPQRETEPQPMSRRQGVLGLFQTAALPLFFTAPVDAATLMVHADPIATAASDLAANDPRFAKILDTIIQVGPYGALLSSVAPMVLQLLSNHGLIPEDGAKQLGLKTKDELLTLAAGMATNGQDSSAEASTA